jgi:hypothetical protein
VEPSRPTAVRRAAALLAVEGVALTVLGVVDGVATVVGTPDDRTSSLMLALFAVATGVLLLLLARAVDRLQHWARSPAIVLQLLALPVGTGLAQGRVWVVAVPVFLLAGATLFHFATPQARAAFRES